MRSIRHAAMDYLARREHTQQELSRKLAELGYDVCDVEQVIAKLVEEGLQSDARFVISYINSCLRRGLGRERIKQELYERGVNAELSANGLMNCNVDWNEHAFAVWQKKFSIMPDTLTLKAKQQRFLLYRGFGSDEINFIFRKVAWE